MDGEVLLVAGNPNLYPLEYYDSDTGGYAGVLPELLTQFAQERGYDLQYVDPGSADLRSSKMDNLQVDIVSGCSQDEVFLNARGEMVVAISSQADGQATSYGVYVSYAAKESLVSELSDFFASTGQETATGMLIQSAAAQQSDSHLATGLGGLAFAATLIAVVLAIIVFRLRRRLKKTETDKELDSETGLGNLEYLRHRWNTQIREQNRVLYHAVYFRMDVDAMESGAPSEDIAQFMRHTASVLLEFTGPTDILGRVSESGFLMLRVAGSQQASEQWLDTLYRRLSRHPGFGGEAFRVSAGLYMLQAEDWDLDAIISSTSQCALAAFRQGKDWEVCTREMLRDFDETHRLRQELIEGLGQDEFLLFLQFYVSAATGQVVGAEAMPCWQHPRLGLIAADRFAHAIEGNADAIGRLGYWCLEASCAFLDWAQENGMVGFFVSCNFSVQALCSEDFAARCLEITERHSFAKNSLVIGMSGLVNVSEASVKANISALRQYGLLVAADNFGAESSSLGSSLVFDIDCLQLDKCLADALSTDKGRVLARSIIKTAHELGLSVIAKGVETDEQLAFLRQYGCDVIQGFRFYRPLPEGEARRILRETRR